MRKVTETDPSVLAAVENYNSKKSDVNLLKSKKEFQVTGSVFGGSDDLSQGTEGLAVVLNASRLIYDGGRSDALIAAEQHRVDASEFFLRSKLNEQALYHAEVWVQLRNLRL